MLATMRIAALAFATLSVFCTAADPSALINSYDSAYGVLVGQISSSEFNEASGFLYAVNDSALQLVNFTWSGRIPDAFFWLDSSDKPTRDGVRLSTFEFGNSPIGQYSSETARTLLILPEGHKVSAFKSFSIFSLQNDIGYGSVQIPDNLVVPKSYILPDELQGNRYRISGVVQILDTRTIKIIGFSFEGYKAPDGYFFVGKGLNVSKDSGAKAAIRGRDTFDMILPMNERYNGGRDIYVELPEGYDFDDHIDYFSIYSIKFEIVYALVQLKNISRLAIPPFVPAQKSFEGQLNINDMWNLSNLLGTPAQQNFTFQLGPAGGKRGYQALHRVARPPLYVWYVNGYLANLYLKRGIAYTFIVEGGKNSSTWEFHNPLYLTNDGYGGHAKLSNSERQTIKIYAPENPTSAAGRLCRWQSSSSEKAEEADKFASFVDFRITLKLKCDESDKPAVFTFVPTADTPDVLYFESYNNYQMGSKIFVVDEFPADLKHIVEEPFHYDAWQHQNSNLELTRENSAHAPFISFAGILCSFLFAALAIL